MTLIAPHDAAMAAIGLVFGAVLGWPMGWLAGKLARRSVPPWTTSLVAAVACSATGFLCAGDESSYAAAGQCLCLALVLLAAVDIAALRLPDVVTLPLAVAGLLLGTIAREAFADRLIGMVLGFGCLFIVEMTFRRLSGRSGLGLGDAKLFAAAGAWLGWVDMPRVLLLACAGGLAWVATRCLIKGRATLLQPIPFGAGICLGWLTVWTLR